MKRFAISLLAVGCVYGSALAAGIPANAGQSSSDGGSGSFEVGKLYCYVGAMSWNQDAEGVEIVGPGTLRYVEGTGAEVTSTHGCIANLGADALKLSGARSAVECLSPVGAVVTYQVASAAAIISGVAVWRDEVTSEVFLSTLACRVRRVE